MFYRENGQFKTDLSSGSADLSDPAGSYASCCVARVRVFCGAAVRRREYLFRAILIPFLILSLAAIGFNLLAGYCGQVSLGTGAFMAVGAYAAYNCVRVPGMNFSSLFMLAGLVATVVGVLFGIPSLRIKGLYLAVATLSRAVLLRLAVLAREMVYQLYASGSVSAPELKCSA